KLFKDKYEFTKNIHIIPTGIEVDRFFVENVDKKEVDLLRKKLDFKKKDFIILFVGRLAEEKNVEFLINAHKKIIENEPNIKLLIVGDGPDKPKYEQLAKDIGIEESVIFNGKAAWEEIPIYYHVADLFATASTSETQGLTVIEAMASGTTPLCIRDESFIGTVTDELNGRIFDNEEQYINQVMELYKDKNLRDRYNNQARIQAEHCSSRAYASSVLEVYERAMKDKEAEYRFGIISKLFKKFKGE
ncbi:MAG: glycosyltransferase, partial [Bacilli bacterium]|nr:glycosyltransferase [Bacilli bacterium]